MGDHCVYAPRSEGGTRLAGRVADASAVRDLEAFGERIEEGHAAEHRATHEVFRQHRRDAVHGSGGPDLRIVVRKLPTLERAEGRYHYAYVYRVCNAGRTCASEAPYPLRTSR